VRSSGLDDEKCRILASALSRNLVLSTLSKFFFVSLNTLFFFKMKK
jgi:hypothetical protein